MQQVLSVCLEHNVPAGVHVVTPDPEVLSQRLKEGYRWIAYSIDTVFLTHSAEFPR
jgi:2-dehydro-3-deoxyglucarate aldolase